MLLSEISIGKFVRVKTTTGPRAACVVGVNVAEDSGQPWTHKQVSADVTLALVPDSEFELKNSTYMRLHGCFYGGDIDFLDISNLSDEFNYLKYVVGS